jgi:carbon catabolite-derepressing protein kinase
LLSPAALSPNGGDVEENPFESEFNDYDDEEDDEFDFSTPPPDEREREHNNFAVLNSSLPDQFPEQHHLTSYASAKRAPPAAKEKKQHRTKWHFGIRSRSPPMEVMLEIYRTLKTLGMEWREKKDLGGLGNGNVHLNGHTSGRRRNGHGRIERAREYDGAGHVDLKAAASVYFIETRVRVQDVVVRSYHDSSSFSM